ncbi:MAG: DUF805 domain-containing protein [Brevundimonas sp.]|jgi:uncharacterized membrane protein YhaH (DUF805 family)|uniref:DUF805 domain-containing protein n=1 Tax=Brevundimonas sp. TaxID=1871086 RepID=UPI00391E0053
MQNRHLLGLLFSFKGRARRSEWWAISGVAGVLSAILALVLRGFMNGWQAGWFTTEPTATGQLVIYLLSIPFIWWMVAVAVRRAHDLGGSGWLVFATQGLFVLLLIYELANWSQIVADPDFPYGLEGMAVWLANVVILGAALWMLITQAFLPGQRKANRFGPSETTAEYSYQAPPAD